MTLIVDYGLKREVFDFFTEAIHLDRGDKISWCNKTFKYTDWHYYFENQRIYFKKQKHLMLFLLKWGT
jgi:hypothetical protein